MNLIDARIALDYALLQSAAECYLDGLNARSEVDVIHRKLREGANNAERQLKSPEDPVLSGATRFTDVQAKWFTDNYEIVTHYPNDSSGFSATLFKTKNKQPEEYILSFRSTEYQFAEKGGDYERDGIGGTDGDVSGEGYGLAQLASMERFYTNLKQGKTSVDGGAHWVDNPDVAVFATTTPILNVTGYSLGAHLSTSFTLMHNADVNSTWNFNAAGVGGISPTGNNSENKMPTGSGISALIDFYNKLMHFDGSNITEYPDWWKTVVSSPAYGDFVSVAAQVRGRTYENVYDNPLHRKVIALLDPIMYPAGAGDVINPFDSIGDARLQDSIGNFNRSDLSSFNSTIGEVGGLADYPGWSKISQYYGRGSFLDMEFVANSGWHVAPDSIYIEDLPFSRAFGLIELAVPSFRDMVGEFGETHSITPIVDSLTVLDMLQQMDASVDMKAFTRLENAIANSEYAYDNSKVLAALAVALSEPGIGALLTPGLISVLKSSVVHDSDALENTVNAMSKLFLDVDPGLKPNTDPREIAEGYGNLAERDKLHKAIEAVNNAIETQKTQGATLSIRVLAGLSASELSAKARQDDAEGQAYRYALTTLNPIVVVGADYSKHNQNGALDLMDQSGSEGLSKQWIEDRAAFLALKMQYDTGENDADDGLTLLTARGNKPYSEDWDTNSTPINTDFIDLAAHDQDGESLKLVVDGSKASFYDRQIVFGSSKAEELEGSGDTDHLYGGAGNDTLNGLGGSDYVEGGDGGDSLDGGAGSDTLIGGAGDDLLVGGSGSERDLDVLNGGQGVDRYVLGAGFNTTEIIDADGLGRIEVDGVVLGGGKFRADNLWVSDDGAWRYVRLSNDDLLITQGTATAAARALTVKGYFSRLQRGALGLELSDTPSSAPDGKVFLGDFTVTTATAGSDILRSIDNDSKRGSVVVVKAGQQKYVTDSLGNLQAGSGAMVTDNAIWGTSGADTMRGLSGNDLLDGGAGNDWVDGGADDDMLAGGAGSDTLFGGVGDDVIFTSGRFDHRLQQKGPSDNDWSKWHTPARSPSYFLNPETGQSTLTYAPYNRIIAARGPSWGLETYLEQESGKWYYDGWISVFPKSEIYFLGSSDKTSDYAFGGEGNDDVSGGWGNDLLDGGIGNDLLDGVGGHDTLVGGDGSDLICGDGTPGTGYLNTVAPDQGGRDLIDGGSGNDLIWAGGNDDVVYGGSGDDKIFGDHGHVLVLGAGDDVIHGDAGDDILYGEYGDDLLLGGDDNDQMFGDEQVASEEDGDDLMYGDAGDDSMVGGEGGDTLFGGEGNDRIWGDTGMAQTWDGNDWMFAGAGNDTVSGGGGDDYLEGGNGDDLLVGDHGYLSQAGGNDTLWGGAGRDSLYGDTGDDVLNGGDGDDYLSGGKGNDTLYAEGGNDVLDGGVGDDTLVATGSQALLRGGAGRDVYDLQSLRATSTIRIEDKDTDSVIRGLDASSWEAFTGSDLNAAWMDQGDVLLINGGGGTVLLAASTATGMYIEQQPAGGGEVELVSVTAVLERTRALYGVTGSFSAQSRAAAAQVFRDEPLNHGIAVSQFYIGEGGDYFRASDGGESVNGGGGDDWLEGSIGNDRLQGGSGSNTLEGGRGNDVLIVAGTVDELRFSVGDGDDTVGGGWATSDGASNAWTRIRLQGASLDQNTRVVLDGANTPVYLSYGDQADRIAFVGWKDASSGYTRWQQTVLEFDDGQTIGLLDLAASYTGTDQDDVIYGPQFGVTLRGGAGDDVFYSSHPGTVFEGGTGNDTFNGLATYLFSAGWGNDRIIRPSTSAGSGLITLDFGQTVSSNDVTFERYVVSNTIGPWSSSKTAMQGWVRLVSRIDGSSVEMPVTPDPGTGIYSYCFKFSDRTLDLIGGTGVDFDGNDVIDVPGHYARHWDFSVQAADGAYRVLDGQGGDDVLNSRRYRRVSNSEYLNQDGYWNEESPYLLKGGAGNDTLRGALGDTLEGGVGNDRLVMNWRQESSGSSTHARFSIGDGQDTLESDWVDVGLKEAVIEFGPGVTQQSVRAEWVRTSPNLNGVYRLVLHYGDQGDQVTLLTSGDYDGNAPDTRLRLSDGTEVSVRSVLLPSPVTPETVGDDVIFGGHGQDSILSGPGNDRIVLDDSDSYTYRIGHGNDVVETIQGSIQLSDVTVPSQVVTEFLDDLGNELRISFVGSSQTLLVRYDATAPWPRQIYMADGSLLPVRVPTRFGTDGDDNLQGTSCNDDLRGMAGNDFLVSYDGNDLLDGGTGADYMEGGKGDDTYWVDNFVSWEERDQVIESYGEGQDTIIRSVETSTMLDAEVENLDLIGAARTGFGNELNNLLRANDAGSYLGGLEGDDTLLGGVGEDSLWGHEGDDLIQGGHGDDYVNGGLGNDIVVYNRGDGVDTMSLTDLTTAVDTLRLGAGILEQDVVLQNMSNSLYISVKGDTGRIWALNHFAAATQDSDGNLQDHKLDRIEFASGAVWDAAMIQTMVDREASNRAPTVNNAVSTPTLQAKAGALFSYTFVVNTVVDPDPWDSITYSATMSNGSALPSWLQFNAQTRTLSGTPGTSNIGSLQFVLWGTDLYGRGTGKYVTLNVGAANRAPVVSAALVDQQVGPGTALSYTFASGAFTDPDADALSFSAMLADGNALPSWLSFNASTRTFSGTAPTALGTFSVRVTALDAYGGSVNDVFDIAVSNLGVTRTGTSAAETLTGTAYADSLSGLAGNDTLVGNAGNDTLDGGAGTDNMQGGSGDDVYVVDVSTDVVTEAASSGTDTVRSSITYTLGTNLENLLLLGTSAINATGNAVANVLTGNAAANTLNGLGGADTMIGGAGNDTYVVENQADVVLENAGEGTDLVQSSVSYSLSANVENLTLTGTSALSGTGNAANNQLTGNSGANVLDGGAGADTMTGGAGNDTYYVDNAADVVTEGTSAGTDTVLASVTYTLATNVEKLTLTGTAAINGIGNTLANTLTGNAGDNVLNGGTGADTMVGGLGNDTYVVDATTDVVTEAAGAGIDTVQTTVTLATLAANVENLTLLGSSALSGTGNTLDNVLTGNSGANTLTGGAGADTLIGGGGADRLVGGTGNDTYRLGRGSGADTVIESDTTAGNSDRALFESGIAVEQLWFRKVSNNLEASIIGTSDKLILTNWYLGSQYQVEKFEASDGQVLLSSQVQSLVQAMAAFSPPAAGQSTLPANYQTALNPVIAASWN